jgi:SRSO17 transposase
VGFVTGLLAELEVKTSWQLAEHAGYARPDAMQRLLYRAKWDADAVRDDVRQVVIDRLGDPDGVLVVDETGFLKKGVHTVGVQRQYTGTAGRIENAQVGVFLAYASRHGHTLIDRRVYLPESWTSDPQRCEQAGIPATVEFATRSQLADDMITAAIDATTPARWVTADEAYGNNTALRARLRRLRLGYVLAISRDHLVRSTAVRPDAVPTRSPPGCPPGRGHGAAPATARKGHVSTTGPGSPTSAPTATLTALATTAGTACSSAATTPPAN